MESLLAILIGGLFASAIYMILRRSIIKLINWSVAVSTRLQPADIYNWNSSARKSASY